MNLFFIITYDIFTILLYKITFNDRTICCITPKSKYKYIFNGLFGLSALLFLPIHLYYLTSKS